ncbi:MAG TPA: DUF4148 domain-containing protein [Burkholderiaceae bacterium]|nr:DUF4148 domain-containing protein [Burkholderiaceae bacterium]
MNAKLLFVATVAVSLASTLAMADEAPLTRAQVIADLNQAAANGTLQRTDYDFDKVATTVSTKSREQVVAELAAAKRPNPLLVSQSDRSRTYNQFGTELLRPSTLARAEVKAEVVQAQRDGTLPRSDYEDDRALVARRVQSHTAKAIVAQQRDAAAPAGY